MQVHASVHKCDRKGDTMPGPRAPKEAARFNLLLLAQSQQGLGGGGAFPTMMGWAIWGVVRSHDEHLGKTILLPNPLRKDRAVWQLRSRFCSKPVGFVFPWNSQENIFPPAVILNTFPSK